MTDSSDALFRAVSKGLCAVFPLFDVCVVSYASMTTLQSRLHVTVCV